MPGVLPLKQKVAPPKWGMLLEPLLTRRIGNAQCVVEFSLILARRWVLQFVVYPSLQSRAGYEEGDDSDDSEYGHLSDPFCEHHCSESKRSPEGLRGLK